MNATYKYVSNGASGTATASGKQYNIQTGGVIFYYESGQLSGMKNLTGASVSELSSLSATCGGQKRTVSDGVQVYLKSGGGDYYLTALAAVNTTEYTLTGYYDTIYPAGGVLRILIAERK